MNDPPTHALDMASQDSLPRPGVSIAYRLALVLVAIAMVLLPLIYIALITALGYGLFLYLQVAPAWFGLATDNGSETPFWGVLGFLTPIIAAVTMILFMVKPLFLGRIAELRPLTLDPAQQEELFGFVHRLCDVVGAPRPSRIDVDCAVNASAGFERCGWGLTSDRLVLTIGLPLAAGLDLRGLAGVLAHEFGHFAQGTGMRLTYVIRSVNFWFARVVFERDAFDVWLELNAGRADFRIAFMLKIMRFFVGLTSRVLWALMMVGHGISCYMLRQMEFGADLYEARLSGAESFERTMLRLIHLNVATAMAFEVLQHSWNEGRLPEDLADLIVRSADSLPDEIQEKLEEGLRSEKTGFFDTHPATLERTVRVNRRSDEGIIQVEAPATILFHEFEALSREATLKFYRDVLGDELERAQLVPVDVVLDSGTALRDQLTGLERIFTGDLSILRPLWLPDHISPAADWDEDLATLQASRLKMSERAASAKEGLETYAKEEERRMKAAGARVLIEANIGFAASAFGLGKRTEAAAVGAMTDAEARQAEVRPDLDAYLECARAWLAAALRLRLHPRAAEYLNQSTPADREIIPLLQALSCLREAQTDFNALHETFIALSAVLQTVSGRVLGEQSAKRLDDLALQLRVRLKNLHESLQAAYPFEHAVGAIRIGDQVVGTEIAELEDFGSLYTQCGAALERYQQLYFRLLGIMAQAAESFESELAARSSAPDGHS